MPCTDGGYDSRSYDLQVYKERLDKVTDLLCGLMTHLEGGKSFHSYMVLNPELKSWWTEHKEKDRVRRERERAVLEEKKKEVKSKIAKLMDEHGLSTDDLNDFLKK